MGSENKWMDAVACGVLTFRRSDTTDDTMCEYANSEAVSLLGEAVGRTWEELTRAYTLPIHFEDEVLSFPDGRVFKVVKREFEPGRFVYTLSDVSTECSTNKEMEEFLFIASHDLQEPLRKITSFGERISRNTESLGEENSLYFSRMMSATGRMQKMLNGLLALSRVNQNTNDFVVLDLQKFVADAYHSASQQIVKQGVKFSVGKLPVIDARKAQILQLFEEVFLNALRFQNPGRGVEIEVSSEVDLLNKKVRIKVSDNGIGFDNENADRIFLLFHRLNGRAEYEGSGIGLAICKKIVEKHFGEIRAFSEKGKGTTIEITLPLSLKTSGSVS